MIRLPLLTALCTALSCAHSTPSLHPEGMPQLRTLRLGVVTTPFAWTKGSDKVFLLSSTPKDAPTWNFTETNGHVLATLPALVQVSEKSEQKASVSNPVLISTKDRIVFEARFEVKSLKEKPKKPGETKPMKTREGGRSIDAGHQLLVVKEDGTDVLPVEPAAPSAYNAEPAACSDGSFVFTSDRDGDLDLYLGQLDNWGVLAEAHRITDGLGYDGEAQFSPQCRQITWTASRPINRPGKDEAEDYLDDLSQHWLRTSTTEIWIGDRDGKNAHALTLLGAQSKNPTFTPDGKSVVFSTNWGATQAAEFALFQIDLDGKNLIALNVGRINAQLPRFSPDGGTLGFIADTTASGPLETKTSSLFLINWRATAFAAKR